MRSWSSNAGAEALPAALRHQAQREAHPPESGSPARQAPAFELQDLKGRPHNLTVYAGKTLDLFFFATWCPPCVEQLRQVEIAAARLRGRGYRILLVAMRDRESPESLKAFAEARTLGVPLAWDGDGAVAESYRVTGIPTHVVIAPNGRIVYKGDELPAGFEQDGAGLLPP